MFPQRHHRQRAADHLATCSASSRRRPGTFLIGPMAKLGWGTPTLDQRLARHHHRDSPGNIAILGVLQVRAARRGRAAPRPAGELHRRARVRQAARCGSSPRCSSAASCSSRIDGEMGLLIAWGDDANFVVSRRRLPPAVHAAAAAVPDAGADLARRSSTSRSRAIRVEGYFAVTSNTAQFGAGVGAVLRLQRVQRRGPPRLRRAVPVLAVLFHHRRSRPRFGQGVRHRRLQRPHPRRARGADAVARRGRGLDLAPVLRHRRPISTHLGRQRRHDAAARSRCMPILVAEFAEARELAARCRRSGAGSRSRCARSTRRGRPGAAPGRRARRSASAPCRSISPIEKVGNQKPSATSTGSTLTVSRHRPRAAGRRPRAVRHRAVPGHGRRGEALRARLRAAGRRRRPRSPAAATRAPAHARQARRPLRADHHRQRTTSSTWQRFFDVGIDLFVHFLLGGNAAARSLSRGARKAHRCRSTTRSTPRRRGFVVAAASRQHALARRPRRFTSAGRGARLPRRADPPNPALAGDAPRHPRCRGELAA